MKRTLLALLALFVGFMALGAVLQATGAVPPADTATEGAAPAAEPPALTAPVIPAAQAPAVPSVATGSPSPAPAAIQPAAPNTVAAPVPAASRPVAPAQAAPQPVAPRVEAPREEQETVPAATSYANCDAVRAAGAAPIHRGDPGYSRKLDRDDDGVGCEN